MDIISAGINELNLIEGSEISELNTDSSQSLQTSPSDETYTQRQSELAQVYNSMKELSPQRKPFPDVKFTFKVRNRQLTDVNSVYECNAW
jgi:hypothetical protein